MNNILYTFIACLATQEEPPHEEEIIPYGEEELQYDQEASTVINESLKSDGTIYLSTKYNYTDDQTVNDLQECPSYGLYRQYNPYILDLSFDKYTNQGVQECEVKTSNNF
jgi:hypothetical protein